MTSTLLQLLGLLSGFHFRAIKLSASGEEELPLVSELVDACSDTLKYLRIAFRSTRELSFVPYSISYALRF